MRLGCNQSLLTFNLIFITFFSLSISCVFTIISTFFFQKLNRFIVSVITFILTIIYYIEIIFFNLNGTFLPLSKLSFSFIEINDFNNIMNMMSEKVIYLLLVFLPFVLFLFTKKSIFPFKPIPFKGKFALLLLCILLHFTALGIITIDKPSANPQGIYYIYNNSEKTTEIQEKFGFYTMEKLEIIGKNIK